MTTESPIFDQGVQCIQSPEFDISHQISARLYEALTDDLDTLRLGDHATVPQSSEPTTPAHSQSPTNRRRAARRARAFDLMKAPKAETVDRVLHSADAVHREFTVESLPSVRGAFTAKAERFRTEQQKRRVLQERSRQRELKELLDRGYQYVPYQGRPIYFVDRNHIVFAVITGHPLNGYPEACMKVFDLILYLSMLLEAIVHKRGAFAAVNYGLHHGQGLKEPVVIKLDEIEAHIIQQLLADSDYTRILRFNDEAFKLWFPELYSHYEQTVSTVEAKLGIQRPFPGSVFPGMTVNFGGQVTCKPHRDTNNLPYGFCAITALGRFDHTRSAHLVLDEAKLVVEFPHAVTAFIMSAPCTHSNLGISEGDMRSSVTQYAAGPIFRYVFNECMTEEDLRQTNPEKWAQNQEKKDQAWVDGLGFLPTVDKIRHYKELYPTVD